MGIDCFLVHVAAAFMVLQSPQMQLVPDDPVPDALTQELGQLEGVIASTRPEANKLLKTKGKEAAIELWISQLSQHATGSASGLVLSRELSAFDPARARQYARRALAQRPESPLTRLEWARHLYRQGRIREATTYCNLQQPDYLMAAEQALILMSNQLSSSRSASDAVRTWNTTVRAEDRERAFTMAVCSLNSGVSHEVRRTQLISNLNDSADSDIAYDLLELSLDSSFCAPFQQLDHSMLERNSAIVETLFGADSDVSHVFSGFSDVRNDRREGRLRLNLKLVSLGWLTGMTEEIPTDFRFVRAVVLLADEEGFPVTEDVLSRIEVVAMKSAKSDLTHRHSDDVTKVILAVQRHRTPESSFRRLRKLRGLNSEQIAIAEVRSAYFSGNVFSATHECKELLAAHPQSNALRACITTFDAITRADLDADEVANAICIHVRQPLFSKTLGQWYEVMRILMRELNRTVSREER